MSLSTNIYNQLSNKNELNSFRKAVATNNKQSIQKHLSHMKNLSEMELTTALFICIENFRLEDQSDECLYLLLRNKANPNCEINGQTPLIAACKIGQLTMVKNLVENGAKPDLCNSEGKHPLEFILCSRKQNYDVADYLISVISTVNIQVGKTHALIITVEKEFARIFKMLVDKGATLMFNNEETILHIIMKKKFNDPRKKKKFIKQLANRPQLSQSRDKFGKLPIDYETEDEMRGYFHEIFKQKQKVLVEKQANHTKVKEKDSRQKQASRQKQQKKKVKQQEPSSAVQQEGVDEEQNDEEGYNALAHEEDKEKIVEVVQEDEEQKKIEQQKEKTKKQPGKILTPTVSINNKKASKLNVKSSFGQKSSIIEKSIVMQRPIQKQKSKKINTDKKAKTQICSKKNKSFTSSKRNEADEEKKQQQPKKKLSVKGTIKEDESKKITKKQSAQIKLEQVKVEKKNEEDLEEEQLEKRNQSLSAQDEAAIKALLELLTQLCSEVISQSASLVEKNQSVAIKENQQQQSESLSQGSIQSQKQTENYSLQEDLTEEIMQFYMKQQKQFAETKLLVQSVMVYLENKMKLCIESHINHQFTFKVALYGSQATGMSINESDVDLIIMSNLSTQQLMYIFEFYQIFDEEQILDFKFLKNATIPVIKLNFGPAFKNIKCDITVLFGHHRGLRCVQLMQEFKLAEPLLLPLVLALKRLIYGYKLADPYTGGLSSYSLTLMTIALLQITSTPKTKENVGKIFLEFLFFYGFQLDYVCQAIIIQPPYHTHQNSYGYQQFYNIYQLPNTLDLSSKLVIYDPLDPVNNVGRSTYRIQCLKNLFRVSYIRLKMQNFGLQGLIRPQFMELMQDNL